MSKKRPQPKTSLPPVPSPSVYAPTERPLERHAPDTERKLTRQIISGFPVDWSVWAKRLGADIAERGGKDPQLSGVLRAILGAVIESDAIDWSEVMDGDDIRRLVRERIRGA